MSDLQQRIYGTVLHPAEFREEFSREMARDFEDAVRERGFAPLLGDAVLSLARQWRVRAIAGPEMEQPVEGHPFLAGRYFAVEQGSTLTAFDLALASLISVLLFLAVGFAANLPNQRAIADPHAVQVNHGGAIESSGRAPGNAAHAGRAKGAGDDGVLPEGDGVGRPGGVVRLSPRTSALGWRIRHTAMGGPPAGTLADAMLQVVLISIVVWLTSLLLMRSRGLGRRMVVGALGLLGIAASVAFGEVPAPAMHAQILHAGAPLPSFEVASIRLVKDGKYIARQGSPDEVYIIGRTARFLIGDSFNLPPGSKDRLIGGPDWIDTNEYQVDAKMEAPVAAAMQKMSREERIKQTHLLMQSLLKDRFKLKVHFETRELPAYTLVVAKGGSKLTRAQELPPVDTAQPIRPRNPDDMRGSLMIVPKGGPMFEMIAKGETLDQVANMLTPHPEIGGRPVVNQTGLPGMYDFTMDWAREQAAGSATDASGPGLFEALQQQLGLKLVPAKAQVEVIVIDHIELPSEN